MNRLPKISAAWFFALSVVLCLWVTGCSTGKIKSVRDLNSQELAWLAQQRIPLRVGVVLDASISPTNHWQSGAATNLVGKLQQTRLFDEVKLGPGAENADLLIEVRRASGVVRCGNPAALSRVTLGLYRDTVGCGYSYDFDFVSPRTKSRLPFQVHYEGVYRTGFWPAKNEGFIDLLKFDLASRRAEIEALVH